MGNLTQKEIIEKKNQSPNKEWIEKIENILNKHNISENDKIELKKLYNNIKKIEKDNFLYITKENLNSMIELLKIKSDIGDNKLNLFLNKIEIFSEKNKEKIKEHSYISDDYYKNMKLLMNEGKKHKEINKEINKETYINLKKLGIPEEEIGDFINIFAEAVGINNNKGKITNELSITFDSFQENKDGGILGINTIGNIILKKNVDNEKLKKYLPIEYKADFENILKGNMENKYSENITNILDKMIEENFPKIKLEEIIIINILKKIELKLNNNE